MRVYPVLARNDMSDNLLQFVDVHPNTSQANVPFEGVGNTGYLTWDVLNSTVALTNSGAGLMVTSGTYYGLAAYFLDNVENVGGGNLALTAAQANAMAAAVLVRVAAGLDLELANINTIINTPAGVTLSDLNGVVVNSNSTGAVQDIMRILAGETWFIAAGMAVSAAARISFLDFA